MRISLVASSLVGIVLGLATPILALAQYQVPQSSHLPVEIVPSGQARTTVKFTVGELRKQFGSGLSSKSRIRLKSGATISAAQAAAVLTRVETELNKAGYSLRDPPSSNPVKLRSKISVAGRTNESMPRPPPASNVQFSEFEAGRWNATIGNLGQVSVALTHSANLDNAATGVRLRQEASLVGQVFGIPVPLANSGGYGLIPPTLDGCSVFAHSLGQLPSDSQSASCDASGAASKSSRDQDTATADVKFSMPILLGFEVDAMASLTTIADPTSNFDGTRNTVNGTLGLSAEVWLSMQVTGGLYVIKVGPKVDLRLGDFSLTQSSTASAREHSNLAEGSTTTKVEWSGTYERTFAAFDGSASIVLELGIPPLSKTFEWTIYTWDGTPPKSVPGNWGPFVGVRPAACKTSTGVAGAMCSGACADILSSDLHCGTCDSPVPKGTTCRNGTVYRCRPRCGIVPPNGDDGCGGKCPTCSERNPGTLWCECMQQCTSPDNCSTKCNQK